MSIHIKVSYSEEQERAYIMRLLRPLLALGAVMRHKQGKQYNRLYITLYANVEPDTSEQNTE